MPKKSIKKNYNKNKNVNKNNIKININTTRRKTTTTHTPIPRHAQPIIVNNPANNNQHEFMHILNTFKNDLDELRRVRVNKFENANVPATNALSDNLRQSNIAHVNINPVSNLNTQSNVARVNINPVPKSNLTTQRASSQHMPYHETYQPLLSRTNTNSSLMSNLSNNSIVSEMMSHIPSSNTTSTHSSSNKTININPDDMIILDAPNTQPIYKNPNNARLFMSREKKYRERNNDSDSEIEPSQIKIPNSNLRLKLVGKETTKTPLHHRHRQITQYGEPTNIQPQPPPTERPSRTNLLAIMDAEHAQPTMKAIPNTNDVKEMSSNGFSKPKDYDKKKEKSDIENARYHSYVVNFDKHDEDHIAKYDRLLEIYTNLYPQRTNSEFYENGKAKPPSKARYKSLRQKLNNAEL